jgi:hypothetical protein
MKCRSVFYVSKDAQRSHWKVHKKVCKSPDQFSELRRRISRYNADEAAAHFLTTDLYPPETPETGYSYLWGLQHLERLARQGRNPTLTSLVENTLGMMLLSDEIIESFWAIPGLTTYLLNIDITSDQIKQSKMKDPEYSPTLHMLGGNKFQPEYQLNSEFCNVIGNILVGASCKEVYEPEAEMCVVLRRKTPLATAACRKVMAWMQDPCMLASMPYKCNASGYLDEGDLQGDLGARKFAFPKLLNVMMGFQPGDPDNPSAIAPGLTIEGAIKAIRNDIALDYSREHVDDLESIVINLGKTAKKKIAWEAFSVLHRSQLAVLIFKDFMRDDSTKLSIAEFVVGWGFDNSLWLKVVKESIDQITSPEASSFFQGWLDHELQKILPRVQLWLRLFDVTLPSEVELLICEFAYV